MVIVRWGGIRNSRDHLSCSELFMFPSSDTMFTMSIFTGNNDDVKYKYMHQGKWWSAAMVTAFPPPFQVWKYSHGLSLTPVSSLICLNQGKPPAYPSCLGVGWLSVEGGVLALAP